MTIYLHVLPYSCDVIVIFQLCTCVCFQVTYNVQKAQMLKMCKEKKGNKITAVCLSSNLG